MFSFNLLISAIFHMLYSTYNLKSWVHLQFSIGIITSDNQYCFRLSPMLTLLQSVFTYFKNTFVWIKYLLSKVSYRDVILLKKINSSWIQGKQTVVKNPRLWFHHFDLKYFFFLIPLMVIFINPSPRYMPIKTPMLTARETSSPQFFCFWSALGNGHLW